MTGRECEFELALSQELMKEYGPYFWATSLEADIIYTKAMRRHRKECDLCQMDWEIAKEDRRKAKNNGLL